MLHPLLVNINEEKNDKFGNCDFPVYENDYKIHYVISKIPWLF